MPTRGAKRIAEFILDNPETTLNMSIVQLARRVDVSPSTVTRFCTSIGFSGFPQFKSVLRIDLLASDHRFHDDVEMSDSKADVVQKVFDLGIQGLRDTLVTLDPDEVYRAAELILDADRLFCAPTGMASSGVATLLSHKFLNLGFLLIHLENPSMARRYMDILGSGDVVIAISHSGAAPSVVDFLEQSREHGAATICITNYIDAPVAKVSDVRLITAAGREAPLRGEPIGVRLAHVALVDTLYTVLSILKYKREEKGANQ